VLKILLGLFIGIGFGLASGTLNSYRFNSSIKDSFNDAHDTFKYRNIAIENLNEVVRDGKMYIMGSLKNNNPEALYVLAVQVDFYDKNIFVEQCSTSIKGSLKSQEKRNFKISCDGIVKHDRYNVYLINNARR
jgi:hypothetical protein